MLIFLVGFPEELTAAFAPSTGVGTFYGDYPNNPVAAGKASGTVTLVP
jgi:hypothetical protein